MTSRNGKRRVVRPAVEALEGRALLSATPSRLNAPGIASFRTIHEAGAKAPPVLELIGKATGSIYAITSPTSSGVNTLLLGSGLTQGLPGLVTMTALQDTELRGRRVQVTKGEATFAPLAAMRASYLAVTYTGAGPVAKTGATQTFTIAGKVNGGQGAYSAARGTFSGRVVVDPRLGTMTITYVMKVTPIPG